MGIVYTFPDGRRIIMETTMQHAPTITSIESIAKAFLSFESMTHKKLQKLCYYAYSWRYTLYSERLFRNDFEAWIHGPVSPSLYNKYKVNGWREIPLENEIPEDIIENEEILDFLRDLYESYGHLDGDQLEYITHQERPWLEAREGLPEHTPSNNVINDDIIMEFYKNVLEQEQQD